MSEIPQCVWQLLETKFNIVDHYAFVRLDHDMKNLISKLQSHGQRSFGEQDRIVVEHMDTDFYYEESTVGITVRNFFTVIERFNVPVNVFVFYTNHFGLRREIDIVCKNIEPQFRPLVLESFISNKHYPETGYQDFDFKIDDIECQALTLINGKRSYRHALFNHVMHISRDCLAVNFTVK
jgi:hypothetical protein